MKNLTNASKNSKMNGLLKLRGFELLNKYELSKVKGGEDPNGPPIIIPE